MKPDAVQVNLTTRTFGSNMFYLKTIDSTNKWALDMARIGAEEGTVVVADSQTAGRGRLGREWFSPDGGLFFSIILRPSLSAAEASKLVFAAGLAVTKAIEKEFDLAVETRWPNDVLINGKKVCGILCEMETSGDKTSHVVVGFGVNSNIDFKTFPHDLKKKATSLKIVLEHEIRLEDLLTILIKTFEDTYSCFLKSGLEPVLDEWKKHATFLGKRVTISDGSHLFSGTAVDVNSNGSLELQTESGQRQSTLVGDMKLDVNA
jgi:biotin-[acetyl-CoA-carboxylase] ligase BirA-like protein